MVGGAIPGLVVLSSVRKQAEQARGSKPVSRPPPWPLHQLLPPGSCPAWVPVLTSFRAMLTCKFNKPFFPNLLFGHGVSLQS